MEGYLKKWVKFMYQWQNHYFILHEGSLIYCQSKGSRKKGSVHLSICSMRSVPQDPPRIVINYGMSEMNLRASLVQEKQKWLSIKSKNKIVTQYSSISQKNILLQRQFFIMQSQEEEQISINNTSKIIQLIQEIKHTTTACAQKLDEEYNKLVEFSKNFKRNQEQKMIKILLILMKKNLYLLNNL